MVRTSERKKLINSLEESIQEDMMKLAVNLALHDGEYNLKSSDDENGENEMIMNDIEDKSRELEAILAKRYQHRNCCATLQKAANQRSAAAVRFSWPQLAIAAAVNRYLQRQHSGNPATRFLTSV
ncbi:hypothetical protein PCASD_05676 [Puccinia coronata f. sp. avenae]|uniref:Uncharacterized protein n=1 Tax=Puccinia coronata f. sp. avenae TaxID=200324 RepID=A0A2N5UVH5_9BASI|nr:hypothetical protein PCASD_14012 [Puccinia coronata f. sp. avenae]PLW41761.1 hypothetical protein PCASD_05676 [Puccinia coronata f. sp. avenae]